jgi:hypothetical protein
MKNPPPIIKSLLNAKQILVVGIICSLCHANAADGQKLPGMSQEISVVTGSSVGITPPNGTNVAVMDQSWILDSTSASPQQDHHNGWLELNINCGSVKEGKVKVKGKYYIPSTAKKPPTQLRLTLRVQSKSGLVLLAEDKVAISPGDVNKWVDFESNMAMDATLGTANSELKLVLMLAPMDLAGPIYLDSLNVTDAGGAVLWTNPDFK